ncbi:MAG TPA: hypothetical protein PLC53_00990 [Bacilli bacterium]|nr:hypothetical protein [Bacilli bacterium]
MEKSMENMVDILEIQLALESYEDDTGAKMSEEEIKIEDDLQLLREQKDNLSEEEKIKRSEEILARLNKVLDKIGREKFIFYKDGGINYIYKNI